MRMRGVGNSGWKVDPQTLSSSRAFNLPRLAMALSYYSPSVSRMARVRHTSHVRLKVSKSTNSRATVSSLKLDLYCFRSRLHISVYSDSGIESFMYAFSRPSSVMMIL